MATRRPQQAAADAIANVGEVVDLQAIRDVAQ
jgi:hypothetical protein